MNAPLRTSSIAQEPLFQAGKWLTVAALLDKEEMEALLNELGDFAIFLTSGLTKQGEGLLSHQDFITQYALYVEALKKGEVPSEALFRPIFSTVFTTQTDHLYAVPVDHGRQLIRVSKPVIQLQPHGMEYSTLDKKFRSMVFGDRITWGIQFSYPQIFQNPQTHAVDEVLKGDYPNTPLFRLLQKWIRHNTLATPFVVEGTRVNVPIRLGKLCFAWINRHPQLKERGLKVEEIV